MYMNRKQEKNNNKQSKTSKNIPLIPITKSKHLNNPPLISTQYIQKKTNSQFQKNSHLIPTLITILESPAPIQTIHHQNRNQILRCLP